MLGKVLFLIGVTMVGGWGCAVSAYRRGHADTYETGSGPLAWGARSSRYRGRPSEQIRRASAFEFWFWLLMATIADTAIIYGLVT